MDVARVRAAFDAQMRRGAQDSGDGARVERTERVVRFVAQVAGGWSAVVWSNLDAANADAEIAEQVRALGAQRFEWKLYDYDRPADLGERLHASGFVPEDAESLMVAEISALPRKAVLPDGVRLVRANDPGGLELLMHVHEEVFGSDHSGLRRSLLVQLRDAPASTELVVAMAGDRPVCSARIEFPPDREFASLWGGGTLPEWRGRGIYRALVAHRAELAFERGYRYLQVDASDDSRPILERLGFTKIAVTTPYVWEPDLSRA
jgi:GNAT superfamily N-acetyltransferase